VSRLRLRRTRHRRICVSNWVLVLGVRVAEALSTAGACSPECPGSLVLRVRDQPICSTRGSGRHADTPRVPATKSFGPIPHSTSWTNDLAAAKGSPQTGDNLTPKNTIQDLDVNSPVHRKDCGGIPGFYDLVEALNDPNHERHEEMLDWIGDDFDPQAFSVDKANKMLAPLSRHRRKTSQG
jgi:hypothetical protein